MSEFIVYFIKRVNTLPRMGEEIQHIVSNPRTLRRLGLPEYSAWIRGYQVALFSGKTPCFLVNRSDTGKHEDWLEDYQLEPEPDWNLMCFLNRMREMRKPYRTTRRGPDGRLVSVEPGDVTGKPLFRTDGHHQRAPSSARLTERRLK